MAQVLEDAKRKFQLRKNTEVCPHCGREHVCTSRSKKGARAVQYWTRLSEPLTEFLLWWLNSPYALKDLSKEQVHEVAKGRYTLGHIEGRM